MHLSTTKLFLLHRLLPPFMFLHLFIRSLPLVVLLLNIFFYVFDQTKKNSIMQLIDVNVDVDGEVDTVLLLLLLLLYK